MDQLFIERINELKGRESANRFAKDCGIKPATMLNYLNGATDPSLGALRKISDSTKIPIGWLVGEETPAATTGHVANGVSGVMQAGGAISGGTITTSGTDLDQIEKELLEKLRKVGSPMLIEKWMKQLQDLEDYLENN